MASEVETVVLRASVHAALGNTVTIVGPAGPSHSPKSSSLQPTDSGYGSSSSSSNNFDKDGSTRPQTQEVEAGSENVLDSPQCYDLPQSRIGFFSNKKKLKSFPNKTIPDEVLARFSDLKELFNKPLVEALSKGKKLPGPVLIKLMCLGVDDTTVKPWIVVICDKAVGQRARQFFNQDWFKNQSRDVDGAGQDLDVIVFDRKGGPRLNVTAEIPIYFANNAARLTKPSDTCCGQLMRISGKDSSNFVTFGGVIEVKSKTGHYMYGLTCGHAIYPVDIYDKKSSAVSVPSTARDGLDAALSEHEEEYEIEWDEPNNSQINMNLDNRDPSISYRGEFSDRPHGKIIASSYDPDACESNLDWALVELTDPAHYLPNPPFSSTVPDFDSVGRLRGDSESKQPPATEKGVVVYAGASGFLTATLQLRPSFFLSPGFTDLIRVFSMKMDNPGTVFDIFVS